MILSHFDLESPLKLSSDTVNVLVFEDSEKFYFYSCQLKEQISGESGGFVLYDDENRTTFKSLRFINDYYSVMSDDKKMQAALISSTQQIVEEKLLVDFTSLQEDICKFFEKLNAETDFPIDYNAESGIQPLLKAYGLHWSEEDESLLEKIVSCIQFSARLLKIKCFVFVNLKCVLGESSLLRLYREAKLQDVSLLLLENICREKLENEKITVIDKDFCQFVV